MLVGDSAQVARTIGDRQADLGLSGMPSSAIRYSIISIVKDEVVLAVSSNHRFADERSITIEREGGLCTWQTVVHSFSAAGIELPEHKASMTLGSTQAVVTAVRQNLDIGFVSSNAVSTSGNKVVSVRIRGLYLDRDLSFVYETGRVLGRHTQSFIDFAKTKSS